MHVGSFCSCRSFRSHLALHSRRQRLAGFFCNARKYKYVLRYLASVYPPAFLGHSRAGIQIKPSASAEVRFIRRNSLRHSFILSFFLSACCEHVRIYRRYSIYFAWQASPRACTLEFVESSSFSLHSSLACTTSCARRIMDRWAQIPTTCHRSTAS